MKLKLLHKTKLVKCYIWSIAFCGAGGGGGMEKFSWTDRVRNEEMWNTVKEERNILYTVTWREAKWIGHIWRRICLLNHVIEGEIEGRIK